MYDWTVGLWLWDAFFLSYLPWILQVFFLYNSVITTRIFYSQLLAHGKYLPSDWHRNFQRFTEGVTLPGAPTEMSIGTLHNQLSHLCDSGVCDTAQHGEEEIFLTHYFTGFGLWLFDSMCVSRVSWLWEHEGRAIHIMVGRKRRLGGITSEVYLWRPLFSKDILSLNVSRISPHGNEMPSHISLWGHISFSNHSKVQSVSFTIGHGELTINLYFYKFLLLNFNLFRDLSNISSFLILNKKPPSSFSTDALGISTT